MTQPVCNIVQGFRALDLTTEEALLVGHTLVRLNGQYLFKLVKNPSRKACLWPWRDVASKRKLVAERMKRYRARKKAKKLQENETPQPQGETPQPQGETPAPLS